MAGRRPRVLPVLGLVAALLPLWRPATSDAADAYPSRAVHMVAPWGAGTPPDIVARILAEHLSPRLGQPVVVDNKPGATGTLGLAEVAGKPSDGYTLAAVAMPITVAPALYPHLNFDLVRDFVPVGLVGWSSNVLVVSSKSEVASVPELVARLKSQPGQLAFASGGNGTPAHLAGVLFTQVTGTEAKHAPYSQLPQAVGDVIAGRVDFMFMTSIAAVAQIKGGTLRALAVTGPHRIATLPGTPTMAELGYTDFVVRDWTGVIAKTGTPDAVLSRLTRELKAVLQEPAVRERLAQLGMEMDAETAKEFGGLIRSETSRWSRLVRSAGIKPD